MRDDQAGMTSDRHPADQVWIDGALERLWGPVVTWQDGLIWDHVFGPQATGSHASGVTPADGMGPDLGRDMDPARRADHGFGADDSLWDAIGLTPSSDGMSASRSGADLKEQSPDPAKGKDLIQTLGSSSNVIGAGIIDDAWSRKAGFMITTRMQDHMVTTSDGDLHMLINRGVSAGLTMLTSTDGGLSWTESFIFGNTGRYSTSDMRMANTEDTLCVAYTTAEGKVAFRIMTYDPAANVWTVELHRIVDNDSLNVQSVHPTLALSDNGRVLISYTEETDAGLRVVVTWSDDLGSTWDTTEETIAGVDAGSTRIFSTGNGTTGLLYATKDGIEWATYDPRSDVWQSETIAGKGVAGKYCSHFSTTVVGDNIVVAYADTDGNLRVLRYNGNTETWSDPVRPDGTKPINVTTAQISASDDGDLYIIFDDADKGVLVVMESTDGGKTWHNEAVLDSPASLTASPTRFESPEHFEGDLVITEQIQSPDNDKVTGLYYHIVDVDGSGGVTTTTVAPAGADVFVF